LGGPLPCLESKPWKGDTRDWMAFHQGKGEVPRKKGELLLWGRGGKGGVPGAIEGNMTSIQR